MRRTTMLLLAGCLVVAGCRSAGPGPTRTAHHSEVVPWVRLPPRRPVIASTVVPQRPNPALATRARACLGRDLALRWPGPGAAAGTMFDNVEVDLAPGHTPCAVGGMPSVTLHTVEGTTVPGRLGRWGVTGRGPVLLTRRQHALAQVTWPSACYDLRGSYRSWLTLAYRGRFWTQPVRYLSGTCDFGTERPLKSIGVTRFVPQHVRPARRRSAYDAVVARTRQQLVTRPDRPIDLVVTLVSRHDLVLDPCPDYRLGASPGRGRRLGLDCAAVPWHEPDGRPYLPAGRPVRFAFRLGGVEGTVQKFWWQIVAPGSPPAVAGIITIR